jgi:hypothetical protein
MSTTEIPTAVAARAAEMGGTVVQFRQGSDAYAGCASGLVHWKRESQYHKDGFEHITHVFYVREGETVAVFEAGTYGEASDADKAWDRRVVSI